MKAVLLKKLCQYLGLYQVVFVKKVKCSPTYIRRLEAGDVYCENIIEKACDAFQVNPDYFKGNLSLQEAVVLKDEEEEKILAGKRSKEISE